MRVGSVGRQSIPDLGMLAQFYSVLGTAGWVAQALTQQQARGSTSTSSIALPEFLSMKKKLVHKQMTGKIRFFMKKFAESFR